MNKKQVISFVTISLFIIAFSVILFLIMLPQSVNISSVDSYIDIDKQEYKFENTKDISDKSLSYQYNITGEDIENFKVTNRYKMGNLNPFYNDEK